MDDMMLNILKMTDREIAKSKRESELDKKQPIDKESTQQIEIENDNKLKNLQQENHRLLEGLKKKANITDEDIEKARKELLKEDILTRKEVEHHHDAKEDSAEVASEKNEHHDDAKNNIEKTNTEQKETKNEHHDDAQKEIDETDKSIKESTINEHHDDANSQSKKKKNDSKDLGTTHQEAKENLNPGVKLFFFSGCGAFGVAIVASVYCVLKIAGAL